MPRRTFSLRSKLRVGGRTPTPWSNSLMPVHSFAKFPHLSLGLPHARDRSAPAIFRQAVRHDLQVVSRFIVSSPLLLLSSDLVPRTSNTIACHERTLQCSRRAAGSDSLRVASLSAPQEPPWCLPSPYPPSAAAPAPLPGTRA